MVSVLHDPKYFAEPSVFRPDRFINNAGEFVPDEKVIYFGTGKRRCVGEILGRAEMYIFGAALIKVHVVLNNNILLFLKSQLTIKLTDSKSSKGMNA